MSKILGYDLISSISSEAFTKSHAMRCIHVLCSQKTFEYALQGLSHDFLEQGANHPWGPSEVDGFVEAVAVVGLDHLIQLVQSWPYPTEHVNDWFARAWRVALRHVAPHLHLNTNLMTHQFLFIEKQVVFYTNPGHLISWRGLLRQDKTPFRYTGGWRKLSKHQLEETILGWDDIDLDNIEMLRILRGKKSLFSEDFIEKLFKITRSFLRNHSFIPFPLVEIFMEIDRIPNELKEWALRLVEIVNMVGETNEQENWLAAHQNLAGICLLEAGWRTP
jgi:hypothetical protein